MEKETKRCPYCCEVFLAVAQKCKHCGEWLKKDCDSHQSKTGVQTEPMSPNAKTYNSKPSYTKSKNNTIYIVGAIIAIAIVVVLVSLFSGKTPSNASLDSQDNMNEAENPVEIETEIVYPEDTEEIIEIPGMVQHTEDQGKYIPGDEDPWKD